MKATPALALIELSISGVPESVHEDTPIPVSFILNQGKTANPTIYLRGVFYEEATTKYFGFTQNQTGTWVNSTADKSQFYELTVSPEGTASGTLLIKIDMQNSYFEGAGVYKIKLGRYTSASDSSADWSTNELETSVTVSMPSPSPTPPSPTPSPSLAPSPSPSPPPSPSPRPSPKPSPSILARESPTGTVAGETLIDLSAFGGSPSPSPSPSPDHDRLSLNRDRARIVVLIGSGLLLISLAAGFGLRQYRHSQSHAL